MGRNKDATQEGEEGSTVEEHSQKNTLLQTFPSLSSHLISPGARKAMGKNKKAPRAGEGREDRRRAFLEGEERVVEGIGIVSVQREGAFSTCKKKEPPPFYLPFCSMQPQRRFPKSMSGCMLRDPGAQKPSRARCCFSESAISSGF